MSRKNKWKRKWKLSQQPMQPSSPAPIQSTPVTTLSVVNQFTPPPSPKLTFSPYAWAKLRYMRDAGDTEISGYGITEQDSPLHVIDFQTVKQQCSVASTEFDDTAVADFFDDQVDAGRKPENFARVWLHTHPGGLDHPSSTDEETFHRVFGGCHWAVMFILAKNGATFCRLRFNVGPGGEQEIPVAISYDKPFAGSDHVAWRAEYDRNVTTRVWVTTPLTLPGSAQAGHGIWDPDADWGYGNNWSRQLNSKWNSESEKKLFDEADKLLSGDTQVKDAQAAARSMAAVAPDLGGNGFNLEDFERAYEQDETQEAAETLAALDAWEKEEAAKAGLFEPNKPPARKVDPYVAAYVNAGNAPVKEHENVNGDSDTAGTGAPVEVGAVQGQGLTPAPAAAA